MHPVAARNVPQDSPIALTAGPLARALRDLSAQTGTELLFAPDLIGDRRSPPLSGRQVEETLTRLLQGTGLSYRRTAEGTVLIYALSDQREPAIPEILIVGRRTQNSDIRRTENDIQPYRVVSAHDIATSQSDNIDQYLRARLPSDAQMEGPSQNPLASSASSRSLINLHGLGSDQTLVLVDGARMPGVPPQFSSLATLQPDLNGIPVLAIERIELLTGTAGGIYGPGATGGVVNVVLKRNYRGADIDLSSGLSDRGDAGRRRINARFGFTPDHGRTDVMITVARSTMDGLRFGDRDYSTKARQQLIANDPEAFVSSFPTGNAVIVGSVFGEPLRFKQDRGGASLGSAFTYLPLRNGGDAITSLAANAGRSESNLAPDGGGLGRSLTNHVAVTSVLLNIRRKLGRGIEAFFDVIELRNNGRARFGGTDLSGSAVMIPSDPNNPFAQTIFVSFPMPGLDGIVRNELRTTRLSAGLIARLPFAWSAEAKFSRGAVRNRISAAGFRLDPNFSLLAIGGGRTTMIGPSANPFGPWDEFVSALQAYKIPDDDLTVTRNHFQDTSLRLAGPVLTSPAGPITLSLLAEHRREKLLPRFHVSTLEGPTPSLAYGAAKQAVSSLYGELRAPIIAQSDKWGPLRGLEVQLAVRYDRNKSSLAPSRAQERLAASQSATAYTAGFRIFPLSGLMLRASVATGVLPPTLDQLPQSRMTIPIPWFAGDPLRGGRIVGSEAPFVRVSGGSPDLRPEKARTVTIGMVINPDGEGWPRLAVDFRRIRKRDEITNVFNGNIAYFLSHEADFPDRIQRAPLSASDRAAGFTGGVITLIDTSALNISRATVEAVDVHATHDIAVRGSKIRLYATATWSPKLTRQIAPDRPVIRYTGVEDGTLRWRGNAGFDWTYDRFTFGFNGQFYDGYQAILADERSTISADPKRRGVNIPQQFYVDMFASYHIPWRSNPASRTELELRIGVQNLLDHAPPLSTRSEPGYSYYGDPRRRRYELGATIHF
ncbi:TonB-dependent receptor [Sphingomonas sp. ASY06-1R]|uniref:TonB-dependent receptor n=1 Tax=Sphingomonas sp. ASY06-1R TaxID=3445771 RepID=UPI003FA2039B